MALIFGYHIPNFTFPDSPADETFDRVVGLVTAAEAAGFDFVTVMDHFHQIGGIAREDPGRFLGPETDPMLEAYTTLGALAARTSRVGLATLVTGVTYRNPAMLAKIITTLDVISKGRAILGVGAGWNEAEHIAYGFEFPPIGERMDRLDEALTIARLMFTQESTTFEGKHYRVEGALNMPRPIQPGGPKILVGGAGERRTFRLLARHGDMGHWYGGIGGMGGDIDELKRKRGVFLQHCEAENRDPWTVQLTLGVGLALVENEKSGQALLQQIPDERRGMVMASTPSQAAERLSEYVDIGFGGFTLSSQTVSTMDSIALGGELIKLMA
jgi:F420-dependent oxidoreductase-like protein